MTDQQLFEYLYTAVAKENTVNRTNIPEKLIALVSTSENLDVADSAVRLFRDQIVDIFWTKKQIDRNIGDVATAVCKFCYYAAPAYVSSMFRRKLLKDFIILNKECDIQQWAAQKLELGLGNVALSAAKLVTLHGYLGLPYLDIGWAKQQIERKIGDVYAAFLHLYLHSRLGSLPEGTVDYGWTLKLIVGESKDAKQAIIDFFNVEDPSTLSLDLMNILLGLIK